MSKNTFETNKQLTFTSIYIFQALKFVNNDKSYFNLDEFCN